MASECEPKRMKLDILTPNGSSMKSKEIKFGSLENQPKQNLDALDYDSRESTSNDSATTPSLTLRNVRIHQKQHELKDSIGTFIKDNEVQDSTTKEKNKNTSEKETAESSKLEIIALSDGSDSEATEKEIDNQRNFDFIEEASVMDDEMMDDFPDLFHHNINDEQHQKIFDELLNATSATIPQKDSITEPNSNIADFNILSNNANKEALIPESNNNPSSNSFHKVPDSSDRTLSLKSGKNPSSSPSDVNNQHKTGVTPLIHTTQTESDLSLDILNYLKKIERRLGSIEKRLTIIEEGQNARNERNSDSSDVDDFIDDDTLLSLKFPIKKKYSLDIFENILKVPKMKRNLELKFKQYLGMNESDTIDMILAEMIDSNVQNSFKWRQSDMTRSFENFVYINKLIFDCVKHHFQNFTNVEYIRLMSLILNRPCRASAIQRNQTHSNANSRKLCSTSSSTINSE
uniref:CSON000789 protein n=1 Tax=Culicoides sonorensis TaxID=179676 RepID=A0A336MF65_CULSO